MSRPGAPPTGPPSRIIGETTRPLTGIGLATCLGAMLIVPMPQVLRAMGLRARTAAGNDWTRTLVRMPDHEEVGPNVTDFAALMPPHGRMGGPLPGRSPAVVQRAADENPSRARRRS